MSGTISPRDRLQLWVNTFLLKQKENSGSVTATFRDMGSQAGKAYRLVLEEHGMRYSVLALLLAFPLGNEKRRERQVRSSVD